MAPPALPVPVLAAGQQRVAAWVSGPLLVVGGPGTGKTTVLVESALARLAEGAQPESVLMLAGSRRAAAQMRERLAIRLPGRAIPRVTTFHAFSLDVVTRLAPPDEPPRLLSGAEQERAVREVIEGTLAEPLLRGQWPDGLRDAVSTRGFAKEVRSAFAGARALGLAGDEVASMGRRANDAAWAAVGPLLDDYLETQDQQRALDYAELMYRALTAVHDPDSRQLFADLRFVFVDEYEECDTTQAALLRALAPRLESLVVAGDPEQSIFAFRGANLDNLRDFPQHFLDLARARGLEGAGLIGLDTGFRFSAILRDYAGAVFGGAVPTVLPVSVSATYRRFRCAPAATSVQAFLYDDTSAEAAHTVSAIRAQRAETGDDWDEFAVLTRSSSALGAVERALQRAGIPVRIDVRSGRLVEQPVVRVLLRALEVVSGHELRMEPEYAHELLLSPLCGLDPSEVRAIARLLRTDRRTASDEALAAALVSERPAFELSDDVPGAASFEALRLLLRRAHDRVRDGASPYEALWLLWSGTRWPERLRRQALEQASTLAHRDLDVVCELFDIADRAVLRRQGRAGVAGFVEDMFEQEVPSESLAGRGFSGPAVRLTTAHAVKGLQWKHVFVVGVSEGAWPNLRRRASMLDVDRLSTEGLVEARGRQALFDEERRLFYVACTRASHSLCVSGVRGDRAGDAQPSRFLQSAVLPAVSVAGRPESLDSPDDVIAALRRAATSLASSPALRAAAVARLRRLAQERDDAGVPLFREADPEQWWGVRSVTENLTPVGPADRPLYVRGSSIDSLTRCSLNWFLEQRVHAEGSRGTAVVFGSAIHALADGLAKGAIEPDQELLTDRLRAVWNDAGYDSQWQSARDFEEGLRAIARLLRWHAGRAPEVLASEVAFDGVLEVPTPSGHRERLQMRGSIDRIEVTADDGIVVFDYKTGRSKYSAKEVQDSGQLRYYQLAAGAGLLDAAAGGGRALHAAGAAFVHLRVDASKAEAGAPAVQEQLPLRHDDPWISDVLGAGLELVRDERFLATPGSHCAFCRMKPTCPAQAEGRMEPA